MQNLDQSKVTSRSLQGQSFINSNNRIIVDKPKPYCPLPDKRRNVCKHMHSTTPDRV